MHISNLSLLIWTIAFLQGQPAELLEEVKRACLGVSGVTYRFTTEQQLGEQRWTIEGTAWQARGENVDSIGFCEGVFRFEGTIEQDGKRQAFAFAYDGEKLYVKNPAENGDAELNMIDRAAMHDFIQAVDSRVQMIGVPALSAGKPFEIDPDRGNIRADAMAGERDVAGVACELLRVTTTATAPDGTHHETETTWVIGKQDHLPRMRDNRFGTLKISALARLSAEQAADRTRFRLTPPTTQPAGR